MNLNNKIANAIKLKYIVSDSDAKPGEFTLRLRSLMNTAARHIFDEPLVPIFDIFDKESYEPYREFYEDNGGEYAPGDKHLVLAHTASGKYLIGTY